MSLYVKAVADANRKVSMIPAHADRQKHSALCIKIWIQCLSLFTQNITQANRHLEVVAKRPVAQHLKEGVVVDILANIIQVVVLSPSANTLLAVGGTHHLGHVAVWVHCAKEDRLKLQKGAKNTSQKHTNHWQDCEKFTRAF